MTGRSRQLDEIYQRLLCHFGPQRWWPAETPFEVAIGAILTQNTAWTNVEMAIDKLKNAGAIDPLGICALSRSRLEALIRPAGFFRQKTTRLQSFAKVLTEQYAGEISRLCAGKMPVARDRLLAMPGIGPETADAILLYAGQRPSFVVDAYTRRTFCRLGLLEGTESYDAIRAGFMHALPPSVALFNEYHALLVALAKGYCTKRRPACPDCPLRELCPCGLAWETDPKAAPCP